MKKQGGFIGLIALMISVLIIGLIFVKMNTGTNKEEQKNNYQESIQKAEDIKNILENRTY